MTLTTSLHLLGGIPSVIVARPANLRGAGGAVVWVFPKDLRVVEVTLRCPAPRRPRTPWRERRWRMPQGGQTDCSLIRALPAVIMMAFNRPTGIRPITVGEILVLLLVAWALWAMSASAQLIPLKTAPIATGSQFQRHPSEVRGMGDVSLAVDDTLGDAFQNPAMTARLEGGRVFSAPAYYTITGRDGRARTLSVGGLGRRGSWFGGAAGALQQLDPGPGPRPPISFPCARCFTTFPRTEPTNGRFRRERSAENQYVTVLGGRTWADQWALAGAVQWAGLGAMDGVDLLYPDNRGLRQDGHRLDVRVGVLREWDDRSLRAVLVHDRIDMQHDVRSVNYVRPEERDEVVRRVRWEEYDDRTNTWGLHLGYVQPLGSGPWRLGTALTGNRKSHPKIPNYDLMRIPRDPGTSWAYNVGMGVSRSGERTTFGVDLMFEPVWSETWVNAEEPVERVHGGTIAPGERTVVNDFTFANTTLRTGLRHGQGRWQLQGGLEVRTTRYWLTQEDRVQRSERDQYEAWTEWRLTWGGELDWEALTLRYTGHLTLGTGQPGIRTNGVRAAEFAGTGDFIVAPRGPLTVQGARVFTHQISVILPVGGEE